MVQVKVLKGTVSFEGGTFEQGSMFECDESQLRQFTPYMIEVIHPIVESMEKPKTFPDLPQIEPEVDPSTLTKARKKPS